MDIIKMYQFLERGDLDGAIESCSHNQEEGDSYNVYLAYLQLIESVSLRDGKPLLVVNAESRGDLVKELLNKGDRTDVAWNHICSEICEYALHDFCSVKGDGYTYIKNFYGYNSGELKESWTFDFNVKFNSDPERL